MQKVTETASLSSQETQRDTSGFLKIWLPSFLAFLANVLGTLSINWWLASTPGGSGVLGITVGIADLIAVIAVVLFAGLIDRSDRPTVLNGIKVVMACGLVILVPVYLMPTVSIWLILVAASSYFVIESTNELYNASLETTLADLSPSNWPSSRTAALMRLQLQVARLIAPLISGSLITIGFLWSLPILGIIGISITIGSLLLWSHIIRSHHVAKAQLKSDTKSSKRLFQSLFSNNGEAFQWIKRQPTLAFMLVVSVLLNLIVFPFYTLFPAFLKELNVPNQAVVFGLGSSAYGGGMLFATGLFTLFKIRFQRSVAIVSFMILGICCTLGIITLFPTPFVLIIAMGTIGMMFLVVTAVVGGIWLDLTPADVRVRVFSLRRLVGYVSIPLGTGLMGVAGALIGFALVLRILIGIILVSLVLTLWIVYSRRVKR